MQQIQMQLGNASLKRNLKLMRKKESEDLLTQTFLVQYSYAVAAAEDFMKMELHKYIQNLKKRSMRRKLAFTISA